MTAGINPAVLRLAREHSCSIGAAHALWMADPDREQFETARTETEDEYLTSIDAGHEIDNSERWARRRAPFNGEPA